MNGSRRPGLLAVAGPPMAPVPLATPPSDRPAAPVGPALVAGPGSPARSRRPSARRQLAAVIVLIAVGVMFAAWDDTRDLAAGVGGYAGGVGSLRWQFAPILVVLAVGHYLAAAVAVRAASGLRLAFAEVTLAQFAAAAANRLTPAGIGGVALNTRFLSRRGLAMPEAAGSMAALTILGPVTDAILVLGLTGAGYLIGTTTSGVGAVGSSLARVGGLPVRVWDYGWLARAALVGAPSGVIAWLVRRRITRARAAPSTLGRIGRPLVRLARHPRQLLVVLAASTGTTVILGVALAVSLRMVPGPSPAVPLTTVVSVFVLGSAIGSAVPVPGGVGSTDAGLVAALLAAGVPPAHTLRTVLLFRVVTFWGPPLFGIAAARTLRRRGAL